MSTAATHKSQLFPRPTRGTQRLLKYPILIIVILIVLIELLLYFVLRLGVIIYESILTLCQCRSNSKLWKLLKDAQSYEDYCFYAKELDIINGRNEWKYDNDSYCYDMQLVEENLNQLKQYQSSKDWNKLGETLIEIFNHVLKWFEEESLYTQCNYGSKFIVEEFLHTVEEALKSISQRSNFSIQDKMSIFCRLQQEFGRTCLCLSGGATMTYHQFGAIKALFDNGLLPNIISGTSGGSLVGSSIAVRTDAELEKFLNPKIYKYFNAASEPLIIRIGRLLRTGYMFDWDDWSVKMRKVTKGDMTFHEAYQLTGRIFNVTAISTNHTPVLLNYKTAPNVCIWSAVIASSSLPGCMKASPLIAKRYTDAKHKKYELYEYTSYGRLYCDGSIKYDIPKQRLLEDFNVKFTICVQCNLHVFAFYFNGRGTANSPIAHWGRSGMRGGFLSSLLEKILKLELRKWMQILSDFDLLPQVLSMDLRYTALQETRGTITINPKPSLSDILYLISDPDYSHMKQYFFKGQRITYPYIYMVQNRMRLQGIIRETIRSFDSQLTNGNTLNKLLSQGYNYNLQSTLPDILRKTNGKTKGEGENHKDLFVRDSLHKQQKDMLLRRVSV
eukprot:CAMPEP_0197033628 /NCGR_PEP_ID=MMETSP1384-20130603/11987_1 /TAXON_ID=29189 /ORGANISM="Ammonia sp." /LENGTH=613 /DNA_ID=CAMNT_0042463467 /DNA_START=15 /DNA_END=1856 /DNA_ORIENTATION=-